MFVSSKKYNELQRQIKQASAKGVKSEITDIFKDTGDTIYIAEVDFGEAENESVTPFNGIYKYSATLYYKQFSPITDSENFEKDTELGQYKAADAPIVLLSAWDMEILTSGTATKVIVPCIRKNDNFESLVTISPTSIPSDNSITNDNFGRSIGLRTYEEDGTIYIGHEILGFYEGVSEDVILDKVLTADTSTGVITGLGASKYKLLVRVDEPDGRSRIGYMKIHPIPSEDSGAPSDPEESDPCAHPGTETDDDGEDHPADNTDDPEHPGDAGQEEDHPGDTIDCVE